MISKNTLELLEFPKLLNLISDFANSDATRSSLMDLSPLSGRDEIETRQQQIYEIRRMSHEGNALRLSAFRDISGLLARVRPEGAVLEAAELADFMPVLGIASGIASQMEDRTDCPFLNELTSRLTGFPDILKTLKRSVDEEGNILDTASSTLAELRSGIRRLEGKIRKKLEEIVRDGRISTLLQDDFITTRSGRWVIPVRMDSKGMVPGVVHDVSKSGETAFIEPLDIINLANELENLVADQKAEEIRILRHISSVVRKNAEGIGEEFATILYLDTLNCIAIFADLLQMETPLINDSSLVSLVGARHPLLQLSLRKMGGRQRVVPLDVRLGGDETVMIITGANAGGKTITIKTIGLLLLMALSGMPVPAGSGSSFPLVGSLLIDIGDEQSIENNLSTFSAHISNISDILMKKESKAVILIDELGTGTDPDEGAALACAILKEIRGSGALAFATTHLAEIKGFVHGSPGMVNASMEFDLKTLTPLYKLRIGEPGQSHALEIAKQYGLPAAVIDDARSMLGKGKVEFDRMIADLDLRRSEYEELLQRLERQRADIERKEKLLEETLSEAKEKQKEILAEAYREASDLVSETRRQMNIFLDEIKKAEKSERKKAVRNVEAVREKITGRLKEIEADGSTAPSIDEIRDGDVVHVLSLGYDVPVVEVNRGNNRLKIAAKNMEIEVPLSDIRIRSGKPLPSVSPASPSDNVDEPVSSRIILVGLRVDEALSKFEPFLNHAALAELQEVTVIHGIGKGLLMKAIHEHLTEHPLVRSFRRGTPEEGGAGVTIVRMK